MKKIIVSLIGRLLLAPALFTLSLAACGGGAPGGFSVQVVALPAEARDLPITVKAAGTLQAERAIDIVARGGGRIENIAANEGAKVNAGQVLFDVEFSAAAAERRRAEAALESAKAARDRALSLRQAGAIPQQDFDRANAEYAAAQAAFAQASERQGDARLTAPFAGTLGSIDWTVGQFVPPGATLTRLVDNDPLDVVFYVSERYAAKLIPGQTLSVSSLAFANRAFTGTIDFVAPEVDARTRTVEVKGKVPNGDGSLRTGMLVELDIVVETLPAAIVVPEASIVRDSAGARVFVVNAEQAAESRPVALGLRLPGMVQIVSGLQAGELVVRDGTQKLQPGVPVTLAPDTTAPTTP